MARPFRGVNCQGVYRSKIHPGVGESGVVDRVAQAITYLGFESIRIGGTPLFGGSYAEIERGYGWAAYWHKTEVAQFHGNDPWLNEPWNFNHMALLTAKRAGVSVWLCFHKFTTTEEIQTTIGWCADNGVRIEGVSRDNEPYRPARWDTVVETYETLDGLAGAWPTMYVIAGPQSSGRKHRQDTTTELVAKYYEPGDGVEIHVYCPRGKNPGQWIYEAGRNTREALSLSNAEIMVGEWSGKNQSTWGDTELCAVITAYLDVFDTFGIRNYYQQLGSEYDIQGLWNFATMTPNRGGQLFQR